MPSPFTSLTYSRERIWIKSSAGTCTVKPTKPHRFATKENLFGDSYMICLQV